jgi:hypothetical protein
MLYFEKGISEDAKTEEKENYSQNHIKHKDKLRSFYDDVDRGHLSEDSLLGSLFYDADKKDAMIHAMELIDDYIFEEEIRLACDFSMGGKKQ